MLQINSPALECRIIGEIPYDVVVSRIRWFDQPTKEWPNRIQIDLPNGMRVRFNRKKFNAIKSPVCVECGVKGVKFFIVKSETYGKNPHISLATQDDMLLTRDHIVPRCQGGESNPENIQTMCEVCNCEKSKYDDLHRLNRLAFQSQRNKSS